MIIGWPLPKAARIGFVSAGSFIFLNSTLNNEKQSTSVPTHRTRYISNIPLTPNVKNLAYEIMQTANSQQTVGIDKISSRDVYMANIETIYYKT